MAVATASGVWAKSTNTAAPLRRAPSPAVLLLLLAVAVGAAVAVDLSVDHKPEDQVEITRIEKGTKGAAMAV